MVLDPGADPAVSVKVFDNVPVAMITDDGTVATLVLEEVRFTNTLKVCVNGMLTVIVWVVLGAGLNVAGVRLNEGSCAKSGAVVALRVSTTMESIKALNGFIKR